MRGLIKLFACVALLLSVGMTSFVHAAEPGSEGRPVAAASVFAADIGHADGDADQVPGDAHKGYPHHHNSCHGDHAAAALEQAPKLAHANIAGGAVPSALPVLASAAADPALRPPQA